MKLISTKTQCNWMSSFICFCLHCCPLPHVIKLNINFWCKIQSECSIWINLNALKLSNDLKWLVCMYSMRVYGLGKMFNWMKWMMLLSVRVATGDDYCHHHHRCHSSRRCRHCCCYWMSLSSTSSSSRRSMESIGPNECE